MVLFYLTNAVLDVSLAVGWWTCKQSAHGIYYLASYLMDSDKETPIKDQEYDDITFDDLDEESKSLKLYNEIKKLREELKNNKNK